MTGESTCRRLLLHCAILLVCLVVFVSAWIGYRTWPRKLQFSPPAALPIVTMEGEQLVLRLPAPVVLAEVGVFRDELLAYLHFEYLRSRDLVEESRVLLTTAETDEGPAYRLSLLVDNDLLTATPFLAELKAKGLIADFALHSWTEEELAHQREQTQAFVAAYNSPDRPPLEALSPAQLLPPMAHFLLFKSKTDRRVREAIQPTPAVLSTGQAHQLAGDIIAVAHFYSLPLDFFLGIGAMENNYMDVQGDLDHAVWKRRQQKGDIVLRRRGGRVLVRNYSLGVWQITRETLRLAHRLYLEDKRDYGALPPVLRPPPTLDLDGTNPRVLTTYAGLLFRALLDRFDGDAEKAVGAYNGGLRNPNPKYAAGVKAVAKYARRTLEQAAVWDGPLAGGSNPSVPGWDGGEAIGVNGGSGRIAGRPDSADLHTAIVGGN